jgi:UDP-N-acetylmuramoyl-L-alanyl-D-glutamate--2,6-diaminopimelate ligase
VLLQDVLYKVAIRSVAGNTSVEVNDIQNDSRKIKPGGLFVAVKGTAADGHQFIEKAIDNGAAVIVCEEMPASKEEMLCMCRQKTVQQPQL